MANVAVIAAQTAPAPVMARAAVPVPVPGERPILAVVPDRSGSGEATARFSTLLRERPQPAPTAAGEPAPEGRDSVPFLAQWLGQDGALPDPSVPPDGMARHAAIAAYRRSQAALAETPLVFAGSEVVSSALGQRIDLVG